MPKKLAVLDSQGNKAIVQRKHLSVSYRPAKPNPTDSQSQKEILLKAAIQVFGNRQSASEWSEAPIPSLGGRKPIEMVCGAESERQRVFTILGRIEHGLF